MTNYKGTGLSVMELSHRGKEYIDISDRMKSDLRKFLKIPENYKIFYMQGGASMQFATVVKNLLKRNPNGSHKNANYVTTGLWSQLCIGQAKIMFEGENPIETVSGASTKYRTLPST